MCMITFYCLIVNQLFAQRWLWWALPRSHSFLTLSLTFTHSFMFIHENPMLKLFHMKSKRHQKQKSPCSLCVEPFQNDFTLKSMGNSQRICCTHFQPWKMAIMQKNYKPYSGYLFFKFKYYSDFLIESNTNELGSVAQYYSTGLQRDPGFHPHCCSNYLTSY